MHWKWSLLKKREGENDFFFKVTLWNKMALSMGWYYLTISFTKCSVLALLCLLPFVCTHPQWFELVEFKRKCFMPLTDFQKPKCLHQNNEKEIELFLHTACEKMENLQRMTSNWSFICADIKVQGVPELFPHLSMKAHLPLVACFRFWTCIEWNLKYSEYWILYVFILCVRILLQMIHIYSVKIKRS